MKIYLIRHAPTAANLNGSIIQNYKEISILPLTNSIMSDWHKKMDPYLLSGETYRFRSSHALRCRQTMEALFPVQQYITDENLGEFDCSALGSDKKFWEVTKKEFESYVKLSSADMGFQAQKFIDGAQSSEANLVAVSHGMFIRYMYHFMTGNRDISPYEVINSKGFEFKNLSMLIIDMKAHSVEVVPF